MLNKKRLVLSLLTLSMLSLPFYSQAKTYVYVSAPDIDNVYQYSLDENTGSLEIQNTYYFGGNIQYSMISPDNKYLYAVLKEKNPEFISLEINKTSGFLENKKNNLLDFSYSSITTNPSGNLLFVIHRQDTDSLDYTNSFLRIQKIKDGKIGDIIATYSDLDLYDYSSFDNKGVNIYSNEISSNLKYFTKDEDIAYINQYENKQQYSSSSNNQVIFMKNNHVDDNIVKKYIFSNKNFLYTYNPFDASIKQYSLTDNGLPELVFQTKSIGMQINIYQENVVMPYYHDHKNTLEVYTQNYADSKHNFNINDIKITPDNKFIYTSDNKNNQIIGYKIDEKTGNPKIIGTWEAEKNSSSISIDPDSKWLISTGKSSNYISVFSINNQNGTLHLSERKKLNDDSEKSTEKTISIINL